MLYEVITGALREANISISIADNVYHFSPACDAILEASSFDKITNYINLSKKSIKIVKASFIISFIYNILGLSFAISGVITSYSIHYTKLYELRLFG